MSDDKDKSPPDVKPKKRARGKPFQRGEVWNGNPGGRPKKLASLTLACKDLTHDHLVILDEMIRDKKTPANARVRAVELIFAYGYGKPAQAVAVANLGSVEGVAVDNVADGL